MVTKEFAEATTEINKILSYLPTEYVEKIPIKLRKFFKEVESKEFIPNIDPYKTFEEQELKPKTQTLLTIIYRNYWCTEHEKLELDKILLENDKKYEEKLREKYNLDSLFKNKQSVVEKQNTLETSIIEYKEKNLIQKIFDKIINLFKRK